jgi:large subunit ribosomal protein L25
MQMPTEIPIDVSHLDIGDAIHVSELTLDEEIDLLDEPERIIATVSQPRVQLDELTEAEDGEGEEEEAAEEPTEPEVISRRRDDDDDE